MLIDVLMHMVIGLLGAMAIIGTRKACPNCGKVHQGIIGGTLLACEAVATVLVIG